RSAPPRGASRCAADRVHARQRPGAARTARRRCVSGRARRPATAVMVRPRVQIGAAIAIGPGKVDLLRAIERERSISAAARTMGLTYKRAWLLVDSLNQGFGQPVVAATAGGRGGGGAM